MIEGEESLVKNLYDIIRHDPRHTNCRVLYSCKQKSPIFSNWNMGQINLEDIEFKQTSEWDFVCEAIAKARTREITSSRDNIINYIRIFIKLNDIAKAAA